MKMSKQTIVASELMKNQVPYNVDVMGLPVHMDFTYPSVNKDILFSHRLMKDKNIDMLLDLPEKVKEENNSYLSIWVNNICRKSSKRI